MGTGQAISGSTGLHATLDAAVAAAYGWRDDLPDEEVLSRLLALNHQRAADRPG